MKHSQPLKLLRTSFQSDQLLEVQPPVVLFLGRSNAGKSSLLNRLTHHALARISKTPGKTRSVNYYLWGSQLILVDLPGYGYARVGKGERDDWAALLREFFDKLPHGAQDFLLMDSRRTCGSEETGLIRALVDRSDEVKLLLTKADCLNQSQRGECEKKLDKALQEAGLENLLTWTFVSVKTGEGIEALRRALYKYAKETPD